MTFKIPQQFNLIEQGKTWGSDAFIDEATNHTSTPFIEIDFSKSPTTTCIVFLMISSLLKAQSLNIPVIFNRKGQRFDLEKLPHDFNIGLFTSGTMGKPKLIFHTLESILPQNSKKNEAKSSRWLLCYNPMSFAGLQVILQAIVCGDTLVSAVFDGLQQKAQLAIKSNITAISATPSFIKALLLAWQTNKPPLALISCGGEICHQATLDAIHSTFPQASIRHIYATTETGVVFSVSDKREGFPLGWLKKKHRNWTLSINNNELIVSKESIRFLTGDKVDIVKDRVIFVGRDDGVINVGGVKVNLEKLEQLIIELPTITDARVYAKKNSITGFIVCAEIQSDDQSQAKTELNRLLKQLAPAECPRLVQYCQQITLTDTEKKQRVSS